MSFTIYDASAPVFIAALSNMRSWLDKAASEKPESELMEARLVPDMRPLPAQYQMASDSAKNGIARLLGIEPPSMPDTETSLDDLRDRCDRTIAFIRSADPARLAESAHREVVLKFPGGLGFEFDGKTYLTGFALPNFFFHVTTAYAILRAAGVSLGKRDFLQHLGNTNAG